MVICLHAKMLNLEMHINSSCLDVYFFSQSWYSPVRIHVVIALHTVLGLLRTFDILNIYIQKEWQGIASWKF